MLSRLPALRVVEGFSRQLWSFSDTAPALILHYIRAHDYLPPADFRGAALRCPELGSDDYWSEIKKITPNF